MRTITVTHEIDCEAEYCGNCVMRSFISPIDTRLICGHFAKVIECENSRKTGNIQFYKFKRLPECIEAETNSQVKLDGSN